MAAKKVNFDIVQVINEYCGALYSSMVYGNHEDIIQIGDNPKISTVFDNDDMRLERDSSAKTYTCINNATFKTFVNSLVKEYCTNPNNDCLNTFMTRIEQECGYLEKYLNICTPNSVKNKYMDSCINACGKRCAKMKITYEDIDDKRFEEGCKFASYMLYNEFYVNEKHINNKDLFSRFINKKIAKGYFSMQDNNFLVTLVKDTLESYTKKPAAKGSKAKTEKSSNAKSKSKNVDDNDDLADIDLE